MGVLSWPRHRYWTAVPAAGVLVAAALWNISHATPASAEVTFTYFNDQQTGLCLDSNYSNPSYPSVGAVYTDPCNGGTYQEWAATYIGNGKMTLTDVQTGDCLDSNYSNPAYPWVGAVYTDPCNGGAYQQWYAAFAPSDNDWVLQDVQTGLVLDSNYSDPAYPSVGAVYTDPCNSGAYQQWGYINHDTGLVLGTPAFQDGQPIPQICS